MAETDFWYKKGVPQSKLMANKEGIKRVQSKSKTGKASLVDYDKRPKKKWTFKEIYELALVTGMVAVTLAYGIHLLEVINEKNMNGLKNIPNSDYNVTEIVESGNEEEMMNVYNKLVTVLERLNDKKANDELKSIQSFMEQINKLKLKTDRDYTPEINSCWMSILIVAEDYNIQVPYEGLGK